jgi:hypothetical protein
MKSIKIISFPDFDKKAEEVDLYFRIKRGQLVSNNQETDIIHKDRVKQHITAEAESYMDSIEDEIQMGLVVELEDEEGNRQSVNYIEDIEDAVYSMIYN